MFLFSADDIFKKFMRTSGSRRSSESSYEGEMVNVKERNRLAALAAAAAAKLQAEGDSENQIYFVF